MRRGPQSGAEPAQSGERALWTAVLMAAWKEFDRELMRAVRYQRQQSGRAPEHREVRFFINPTRFIRSVMVAVDLDPVAVREHAWSMVPESLRAWAASGRHCDLIGGAS